MIPDVRAPRGSFSQPATHARPEVSPIEPRHSGALTSSSTRTAQHQPVTGQESGQVGSCVST
eukprot:985017-Prymnesium_polylepis.1